MAEQTKGNRMTKRSKGMYATRLAPPQAFHACGGEPPAPRTRTATAPLVTLHPKSLMSVWGHAHHQQNRQSALTLRNKQVAKFT